MKNFLLRLLLFSIIFVGINLFAFLNFYSIHLQYLAKK